MIYVIGTWFWTLKASLNPQTSLGKSEDRPKCPHCVRSMLKMVLTKIEVLTNTHTQIHTSTDPLQTSPTSPSLFPPVQIYLVELCWPCAMVRSFGWTLIYMVNGLHSRNMTLSVIIKLYVEVEGFSNAVAIRHFNILATGPASARCQSTQPWISLS